MNSKKVSKSMRVKDFLYENTEGYLCVTQGCLAVARIMLMDLVREKPDFAETAISYNVNNIRYEVTIFVPETEGKFHFSISLKTDRFQYRLFRNGWELSRGYKFRNLLIKHLI
jgi:hypothetical protein